MFPSEEVADGWGHELAQLITFIGMTAGVLAALQREFGDFGGRITNIANIPEVIYRKGVEECKVILQAYVAAVGDAAEVPERSRPFFPVETGQAGLLWRIAQRIYWKSTGKA